MTFNSNNFKYVCYTPSDTSAHGNVYLCPKMNLIDRVNDIKDLGITMSANCNFDQHINNVFKQCSRLSGWILRTFISRDVTTMLTLFKCVVLSRLDYGSQLWSPTQIKSLNKIESVQRSFTKFITGMRPLSYEDRLKSLHLYSVQSRQNHLHSVHPRSSGVQQQSGHKHKQQSTTNGITPQGFGSNFISKAHIQNIATHAQKTLQVIKALTGTTCVNRRRRLWPPIRRS